MIVHGGWGGGWEWTPVARLLRRRGHEVFTPTLTGLGERAHLGLDVGLSDHIDDVLAVFRFEELHDVVLCGHSYSGMVVTGVADRIPDRIQRLFYLDAFMPRDGRALVDLVSDEFKRVMLDASAERDDRSVPYLEAIWPPEGVIPDEKRRAYIEKMRPHPLRTVTEPVRLSGAVAKLPRAFVHCTEPAEEFISVFAAQARAEGWPYREIGTAHDLQLLNPEGTSAILHELATA